MSAKKVLITGFGPFGGLERNPSWEGVNSMNQEEIERKYNIHLYKELIDVQYDKVDGYVPKLWTEHQPDLTIHVGVKGGITCFHLETKACKYGYENPDDTGTCPANNEHWSNGPESIATDLDVGMVCEEFNCAPMADGLKAEISDDAGKFLCEYTYYTSLYCRGPSKTMFVHVPLDMGSEQIARGLERILQICLKQLGN